MSLAGTWLRQAAAAMGASVAALAVLLAVVLLVASGGLGSLGQIASGPRLPGIEGQGPTSAARLADTRISAGGGVPAPPGATAGTAGAGAGALTTAPGAGGGQAPFSPTSRTGLLPRARIAPPQSGARRPSGGGGGSGSGGGGTVDSVKHTGRDLAGSVRTPADPLTSGLLDTLLGPQR